MKIVIHGNFKIEQENLEHIFGELFLDSILNELVKY